MLIVNKKMHKGNCGKAKVISEETWLSKYISKYIILPDQRRPPASVPIYFMEKWIDGLLNLQGPFTSPQEWKFNDFI